MADGYDPKKSKVSLDTMQTWRESQVTGELIKVPGIGPSAIEKLGQDPVEMNRITNTHQLMGQYLMLKGPDTDGNEVTMSETNHKFWYFLKAKGITSHRSAIVLAIYEKVSSFFPGLYDANEDGEEDDE